MKRLIFVCLGCLTLGLGCVGLVLPILPATPFFLVTLLCFAKGSKKIEAWFLSTALYKNNLQDFLETKTLTKANKIRVLIFLGLIFGAAIYLADNLTLCIILGIVFLAHFVYILFFIRCKKEEK